MNPEIEKRFKESADGWDYTTIINGKVISRPKEESKEKEIPPAAAPMQNEELIKMLNEQNGVQQEQAIIIPVTEKVFNGLSDFNLWYLSFRELFPSEQREALNTLVGIQDLVAKGCKCNEAERDIQAHGYYQDFFLINQERKNDLIDTIKRIGGFTKVCFVNPISGNTSPFLEV